MNKSSLSKSELSNLIGKKWELGHERRMTYQRMRGFNYAHYYQFPKVFGVKLLYEIGRVRNGVFSLYREVEENNVALSIIEKKLLDPKSHIFICKLSKIIESGFEEFRKFTSKLPSSYNSYSNLQILEKYQQNYKADNKVALPNRLTFTEFEKALTNAINKTLAIKSYDNDEIIEIVSQPSIITPLDLYKKELFLILSRSIKKQNGMMSIFVKKYTHWGMFDCNYNVADEEFHIQKLRELKVNESSDFFKELRFKYKNQKKRVNSIFKKFSDNNHIKSLLFLWHTIANVKEWKNYFREQNSYKMKFMFEEIAKRFSLTLEQVTSMTLEEISMLLRDKLTIKKEEINKRISNSAYVFVGDKLTIVTDRDELLRLDNCFEVSPILTIKGMVVFRGVVKGKVKIVISDKDFWKVNNGDILIAGTTRPSYLPVMHKSAAFVTNEGGLLSHAAIVAREMKKPCIVGTKIATKVLKDGDLVEVDANKGIVKILKKAK